MRRMKRGQIAVGGSELREKGYGMAARRKTPKGGGILFRHKENRGLTNTWGAHVANCSGERESEHLIYPSDVRVLLKEREEEARCVNGIAGGWRKEGSLLQMQRSKGRGAVGRERLTWGFQMEKI